MINGRKGANNLASLGKGQTSCIHTVLLFTYHLDWVSPPSTGLRLALLSLLLFSREFGGVY
jgi:hypothetical protein